MPKRTITNNKQVNFGVLLAYILATNSALTWLYWAAPLYREELLPVGVYLNTAIIILPLALMILFRKKYPKWWFNWNLAMTKFCMRVTAYCSLLDDVYPSTDEEQSVHIKISYPISNKNQYYQLFCIDIPSIIIYYMSIKIYISSR